MLNVDYPFYATVGDLAAASDLVVTVEIGSSRNAVSLPMSSGGTNPTLNPQAGVEASGSQADPGIPITVYEARVSAIHRGTGSVGDTIEIGRTGGTLDNILYEANEARLKSGGTYLLFLSSIPGYPASVLGGDQGVFVPSGTGGFTSIAGDRLAVDPATLATLR